MGVINGRLAGLLVAIGMFISPFAAMGCTAVGSDTHEPGMIRQEKCLSCHETERKSAVSPPHESLPTTCQDCHSEGHWVPAELSVGHPWPLEGAHARSLCASCHVGEPPVYQGTPTLCVGCHQADYDNSPEPGHDAFPTTCEGCHSTEQWVPALSTLDHPWPLEGAHAQASCLGCHVGNPPVYEGTPTVCVGCHQADYDNSAFEGHDAFPTTCQECHTNDKWVPAQFDHSWPLEGAHAQAACSSCHTGDPAVYEGAPTVCVGCHQSDYDNSPYLGHSDFPTTCGDCHNTTAWTPATGGNHPENAFPIESGPHSKYRNDCTSCHDPAFGSSVGGENADCVGCHDGDHTRAKMDGKHSGEPDYPSGAAPPNFCVDCHPDGRN
jgi:hypothetical protein